MRMKARILLVSAACCAQIAHAQISPTNINARTVYHTDGTYTESIQDPFTREQKEITYSPQKVKIAERIYLLNEKGVPVQGNVYDGKGQLRARVQVLFDSFNRQTEQRMINLQGEVYQRIIFDYDPKGKALPAKSINYDNVNSPDLHPAPIDLRGQGQTPRPLDRSQGDVPPAQGNVPSLPGASSGSKRDMSPTGILPGTDLNNQPAASGAEGEGKKGFFGRIKGIFGGKEKKEQK